MKKAIYAVLIMILLAFFSGSVAQDLPRIFSGTISNVDGGARTIVVKSEEKEMVFNIFDDTKIKTEYGVDVPFDKLKNGMSVTVEYLKEGDAIQPLSIKTNTLSNGFGKKQKERRKRL
jgi:hypothetical protein